MKVKKLVKVCLFSVLAFCLCFSFVAPTQVFAEETKPAQVYGETSSVKPSGSTLNLSYPTDTTVGTPVTLEIKNFTFSTAGKTTDIIYSYIKEDSSLFSYQELAPVHYATNNSSKYVFNPFIIGGVGTYLVKAYIKVVDNTTNVEDITVINDAFKIIVANPVSEFADIKINSDPEATGVGQFAKYTLSLDVTYKGKPVNADNLNITWTCTNNTNGDVDYRIGNNAIFTPTSSGHYVFRAYVTEFGMTAERDADINVDYSLYLIIGSCALGVIMLGIVIGVTVMKVKKERVW